MARPPLPIGTHGRIRVYQLGQKRYRARTSYRDHDGVVRDVERTGPSRSGAENALRLALRDRGRVSQGGEVTRDSTVRELGELWLAEMDRAVRLGKRSPTTAEAYRYRWDRHVRDGVGMLRVRELTVSRLDRLVVEVHDRYGAGAAKTTRTVLSGLVGLAVRHDALDRNLVRDVGRIENTTSSARSLTVVQAVDLRGKISANPKAREWDLVDFTDFMLSTGLRIGEAAAITWPSLDLDAATVEVRGTVVRIKGQGLTIKPRPKSKSGFRTLELPGWAVAMLRRRRAASVPNEWAVVFTAPHGGLRDPSNTQSDLRKIFDAAGYEWVTSHVYRKTVATLMDEAGLTARQAADQLGHAKISMTQDNYFGRKVAQTGAAGVLEVFSNPGGNPGVDLDGSEEPGS
ncbi:tyrosine recombinase XerC [Pseudonocardia alni]|uniref:site-specific integrase n=1 Tax=Pseudonocardia alni TaxID=33907 RepID=UPI0036796739